MQVQKVTVNGEAVSLKGIHGDTVVIATGKSKHFEIVGQVA